MMTTCLLWYRNDLRLHDHEPLYRAWRSGLQVVPVYCFDPRQFGQTALGLPKTGAFRAQFLLESVADLRQQWRQRGSDLIVRLGRPEEILPAIARACGATTYAWHREVTSEELAVEAAVSAALAPLGIKSQGYWGTTLYHPDELPFPVSQVPDVFTRFRKQVEKSSTVYTPLPSPETLPPLPDLESELLAPGPLPSLADLGIDNLGVDGVSPDPRGVMTFEGGETAALARLKDYFWTQDKLRVYKETRNGMLGANYSSKFSPWLALGCLSPRQIYHEIADYEEARVSNDSTYWLIFELLWRDYFRFIAQRYGDRLFHRGGLQGLLIAWQQDWPRFQAWQEGMTGYPLVDANMRELAATGFMSNRGRQNVASFLTKNLGIDWRWGAAWFETLLIDYDVCSNWGNWNYTAGVGNDARGFRYFNIPKQSKDYDPNGDYVKHWLPELAALPASKVHHPWQLNSPEQSRYGVRLGVDYPAPVVDLAKSVQANERRYEAAIAKHPR